MKIIHYLGIVMCLFLFACADNSDELLSSDENQEINFRDSCCNGFEYSYKVLGVDEDGCCIFNLIIENRYGCRGYYIIGNKGLKIPNSDIAPEEGSVTVVQFTDCPDNNDHNSTYTITNSAEECESFTLPKCGNQTNTTVVINDDDPDECTECPGTPPKPDWICNLETCEWEPPNP